MRAILGPSPLKFFVLRGPEHDGKSTFLMRPNAKSQCQQAFDASKVVADPEVYATFPMEFVTISLSVYSPSQPSCQITGTVPASLRPHMYIQTSGAVGERSGFWTRLLRHTFRIEQLETVCQSWGRLDARVIRRSALHWDRRRPSSATAPSFVQVVSHKAVVAEVGLNWPHGTVGNRATSGC